jgi:hypothetical protein
VLFGAVLRIAVLAGAFLVSIPVSFFTQWSYLCWVSVPLVRWIERVRMRRQANGR